MTLRPFARGAGAAVMLAAAALLGGCAYDYMQRTDRVAYSTGNAVKANMAIQTTNPSKGTMYDTKGLGKNGPARSLRSRTPRPGLVPGKENCGCATDRRSGSSRR